MHSLALAIPSVDIALLASESAASGPLSVPNTAQQEYATDSAMGNSISPTEVTKDVLIDADLLINIVEGLGHDHTGYLTALATHSDTRIRAAVAGNYNTPCWCLQELAMDVDPAVMQASEEALDLRSDERFDDWEVGALCDYARVCTSADDMALIATSEFEPIESALASNPSLPADLAVKLARCSESVLTWRALVQNGATPVHVLPTLWDRACLHGVSDKLMDELLERQDTPTNVINELWDYACMRGCCNEVGEQILMHPNTPKRVIKGIWRCANDENFVFDLAGQFLDRPDTPMSIVKKLAAWTTDSWNWHDGINQKAQEVLAVRRSIKS